MVWHRVEDEPARYTLLQLIPRLPLDSAANAGGVRDEERTRLIKKPPHGVVVYGWSPPTHPVIVLSLWRFLFFARHTFFFLSLWSFLFNGSHIQDISSFDIFIINSSKCMNASRTRGIFQNIEYPAMSVLQLGQISTPSMLHNDLNYIFGHQSLDLCPICHLYRHGDTSGSHRHDHLQGRSNGPGYRNSFRRQCQPQHRESYCAGQPQHHCRIYRRQQL